MFESLEKLIPQRCRQLWSDYCRYLRLGLLHFATPRTVAANKLEQIRLLEKAIRKDFPLSSSLLARLQKGFVKENLSLYLLLEPLQMWRWLATDSNAITEAQISEIVTGISSSAARMLMVLNNEGPSTYLPMTSLLSACYFMNAAENKDILLQKSGKKRHLKITKVRGLIKNAFIILSIVKSKHLKFLLALELNRLTLLVNKIQNNKQSKIENLDRIKILLYSFYHFIAIRRRTTETKGI